MGSLFEGLGGETPKGVFPDGITDLDGVAADFTVLDIRVTAHRKVQDHGNFFSTIGAGEGVFH